MSIPMTTNPLEGGPAIGAPAAAAAAIPCPPTDLIETDGEPLESDWHRLAMNLLIDIVGFFLRDRDDYFVGGNMFIYYGTRQSKSLDYRGPDFFFVWGRPLNPPRPYWAVWEEEGHYPRFFTPDGEMVLTAAEFERQRADAAEAELAKLKAQVSEAKKNGDA